MGVRVNGITYKGDSIVISNGKVKIDGKRVDTGDAKEIKIEVHGDIDLLDVDVCEYVTVEGNVGDIKVSQGDITVNGNVMDNVTNSQGDITIAGDLNGDAKNSMGNIKAGKNIYGKPKTSMGSIKGEKIYIER
jgi:uncharacterized protein (DUF342 family)